MTNLNNENIEINENDIKEENNYISLEDIANDIEKLEIKSYLPYSVKVQMVDLIINECTSINEKGQFVVDYMKKSMLVNFCIINNYTNIDFSGVDIIQAYDFLEEKGLIKNIKEYIGKYTDDFYIISNIINKEIDQKQKLNNTIEGSVSKFLNSISEKIPDQKALEKMTKNMAKTLKNFSPDDLGYINRAMENLNGNTKSNVKSNVKKIK